MLHFESYSTLSKINHLELSCCKSKLKYHKLISKNYPRRFECSKYHKLKNLTLKITQSSFYVKIKTSSPPTPYYSSELKEISSTSHERVFCTITRIVRGARPSRFTRFAASAERNFILRVSRVSFPALLVPFLWFSEILEICRFWEALVIKIGFLTQFSYI